MRVSAGAGPRFRTLSPFEGRLLHGWGRGHSLLEARLEDGLDLVRLWGEVRVTQSVLSLFRQMTTSAPCPRP